MYIEYITPQRVADTNFTEYNSKGGDYRPTYLIRTSDWKKVPGQEAINGYHTLSYCWEQSGKIIPVGDGNRDCIDEGLHRIRKIEKRKSRRSAYHIKVRTKYVTYNELLQQICKDFDIEYLWYDKICIDQTNKEEKRREIKQMHRIYSNARYTVALVPEVYLSNQNKYGLWKPTFQLSAAKRSVIYQMEHSLWYRRSWTLEEVMMSTRTLVVGRNTHFWSLANIKQGKPIKENDELSNIILGFRERKLKSASQVFRYAHFRTSTKEHDKIYALSNIFHDILSIDIDYDRDFSTTMNSFYRQLAQRDLSVMCFGANIHPFAMTRLYETTMSAYNLPSWTGVAGLHSFRPVVEIVLGENGSYTVDDSMHLHIRCRSYTIQIIEYDIFFDSIDERIARARNNYQREINSMDDFDGDEDAALDWSRWCMIMCAMNYTHYANRNAACCSLILPLSLTESCDECIVLGVLFVIASSVITDNVIVGNCYNYLSPVVVKSSTDNPRYKVIGVILLNKFRYDEPRESPEEFLNDMFEQLECSEYQYLCIE